MRYLKCNFAGLYSTKTRQSNHSCRPTNPLGNWQNWQALCAASITVKALPGLMALKRLQGSFVQTEFEISSQLQVFLMSFSQDRNQAEGEKVWFSSNIQTNSVGKNTTYRYSISVTLELTRKDLINHVNLWAAPISETEMISLYTLFKLCLDSYDVKLLQNLLEQQLNQF